MTVSERLDIELMPKELEELMRDLPRILRELNVDVVREGMA